MALSVETITSFCLSALSSVCLHILFEKIHTIRESSPFLAYVDLATQRRYLRSFKRVEYDTSRESHNVVPRHIHQPYACGSMMLRHGERYSSGSFSTG